MFEENSIIRCGYCDKEITNKTNVEYSKEYGQFYCDFNCAVSDFFDRAECIPFFEDDEFNQFKVHLIDGKLFHKVSI